MAENYGGENFYAGGGSSFNPESGNPYVGFRLNPAQIGFSTNPFSDDQLGELARGIRSGAKVVEINLLKMGGGHSIQQIPRQHFAEMRALAKLTGVKPSIHGPLVDPAGFEERQGVWSEENREKNEDIMFNAMQIAKWSDPGKDIPVIFHSSNLFGGGNQYTKEVDENNKTVFKEERLAVFDRTRKQLMPLSEKERIRFGGDQKAKSSEQNAFRRVDSPEEIMENANQTAWSNSIQELTLGKRYVNEAIDNSFGEIEELSKVYELNKEKLSDEEKEKLFGEARARLFKANNLFSHNHSKLNSMFEEVYEYGNPEQKNIVKEISDKYKKEKEEVEKEYIENLKKKNLNPHLEYNKLERLNQLDENYFSILYGLTEQNAPENMIRAEDFAIKEAAKTFGNLGFRSFAQLGKENSPKVSIENVWNGAMFSRGKDMKKLVDESRKVMADKLMKSEGLSEDEAKKIAKQKIGINFDVGHMNMFRKGGFSEEDMAKEVKEFASDINHMHLTDNFGFDDEHFYPGQGNVPFKKFLDVVAKNHPDIDSVKKIVESGGAEFRNNKGVSMHNINLAAFGVPIFGGSHNAYTNAPTFDSNLNTFGAYSASFGMTNPDVHHSLYGAGFSNLPAEIGGQVPGLSGRSRMGGAPMA